MHPHKCNVYLISRRAPTASISRPYLLNVQPFVKTIQSTLRRALGISKTEARVRKSSDFQPTRTIPSRGFQLRFDIDDQTSPIAHEGEKEMGKKATRPITRFCVTDSVYI